MKPYVKICGISEQVHIDCLVNNNVNAIGFVAYPPSPRFVTPEQVFELCKDLPKHVAKVLVVVNMTKNEIQPYLDAGIDTIQFHGKETADFAKEFTCKVWRAVRLRNESQIEDELNFPCEKFVLDAAPKDAELPGGTGELGDWELTKKFVDKSRKPVLVAGGIRMDNVCDALKITGAAGIDLSSGVEDSPGIKSTDKINQLFSKLKERS